MLDTVWSVYSYHLSNDNSAIIIFQCSEEPSAKDYFTYWLKLLNPFAKKVVEPKAIKSYLAVACDNIYTTRNRTWMPLTNILPKAPVLGQLDPLKVDTNNLVYLVLTEDMVETYNMFLNLILTKMGDVKYYHVRN